jgi:hypothetical protein
MGGPISGTPKEVIITPKIKIKSNSPLLQGIKPKAATLKRTVNA